MMEDGSGMVWGWVSELVCVCLMYYMLVVE